MVTERAQAEPMTTNHDTPTVTMAQAMTANEFHYAPACTPKRVERWRRNGATKTWKTRPGEFRIPVKYGIRDYSYITDTNAHEFHLAAECPIEGQR